MQATTILCITKACKDRETIRLGKVSQRQAEAVKVQIEDWVSVRIIGHALSDETSRWLAGLDQELYDKLAAVDLVKKREAPRWRHSVSPTSMAGKISSRARGSIWNVFSGTWSSFMVRSVLCGPLPLAIPRTFGKTFWARINQTTRFAVRSAVHASSSMTPNDAA
ncbi:MAG: hypothetical protein AAF711_04800 [Planctomycetota bacterium]